jgi:hypothetical protein
MRMFAGFRLIFTLILLGSLARNGTAGEGAGDASIHLVPGQAEQGYAEIQGVAAGVFNPDFWTKGTLHVLPDSRSPLLEPRWTGLFRNIYAPSVIDTHHGWCLFYGAWDGVRSGNDRIYSANTFNFLDFTNRRTVIEHGGFTHVCNVCAIPDGASGYAMVCTAYPDDKGKNKPIFFSSPDGSTWNGGKEPYTALPGDLIEVEGYSAYANADINGVNVILKEGKTYHLYFSNFNDFGHVYRASGIDGRHYQFEGSALDAEHMVNDVKKLEVDGKAWYLMGLHANGNQLWYSLSNDGKQFGPEMPLAGNLGEADRYMVAVGWVTRGRRVLGCLYGAGAVPSLDRNRIFARWLQARVVFVADDGALYEPTSAVGPDRQRIKVPPGSPVNGRFEFYAEDGVTPLASPAPAKLVSGGVYQLDQNPPDSQFENLLDNGLSKWEGEDGGRPTGWSMVGDILTFDGQGGYLTLKGADHGDFILRLDYRLPEGGNSGVFIRQPIHYLSSFHGIEIQILDDHAPVYKDIKPYQHAGSIYSVVPAAKDVIHPAGEWNSMEILCLGSRIRTMINGEVLTDASMDDYRQLENRPRTGRLALQNHGSTLEFRNIRMKRLD